MHKSHLISILTLLSVTINVVAQWTPNFSNIDVTTPFYNPADAGSTDNLRATFLYGYDPTGISNKIKKRITYIDFNIPAEGFKHGFGLIAYSYHLGKETNSLLAGQYGLHKNLGVGWLSLGLQAGSYSLNFDAGSVRFADSTETSHSEIISDAADGKILDINFGLLFHDDRLKLGISVLHINRPSFNTLTDSLNILHLSRDYSFLFKYNVQPISFLNIEPAFRVCSDFKGNNSFQATVIASFAERVSVGASWAKKNLKTVNREDEGYSFLAGFAIKGGRVGYSYTEYNKSHELNLSYNLPLESKKQKHSPHKSIRLL